MLLAESFISLSDLYIAYRKAKQEAYFDTFHSNSIMYSNYESELHKNLKELHCNLTEKDSGWEDNVSFLGENLYIPKALNDSEWDKKQIMHYRSVDPNTDWSKRFKENKKKLQAEYRLIINASVNYQIISALWILKVGHKLEKKLNEKLSYGNRLRRYGSQEYSEEKDYVINVNANGLFIPYFTAYKSWRKNGLKSMERSLKNGKNITAVTMDVASFYHNISPEFMLRSSFLKTIGVEFNPEEVSFTQLLINSIKTWYSQTPDYKENPQGAIPVGLSASKIISNVLLFELDRDIHKNINPIYYGRYVDDIFLVFETPEDTISGEAIIRYISQKVDCIKIDRDENGLPDLAIKFKYAFDSNLKFKTQKQRIFSLSSEHGLDLINQISSQIRAQSSEYRMLPSIPRDSIQMAEKTLLASSDASLVADALRKADTISIRRLGLSLLIRDVESYSKDLSRNEWGHIRHEFYGLCERYLLSPKGMFEYFQYFPRIFQIMISCEDFLQLNSFIYKIGLTFNLIKETTYVKENNKLQYCIEYFVKKLVETVIKASTVKGFDSWNDLKCVVENINSLSNSRSDSYQIDELKYISNMLLISDLGLRPYKDYWYHSQSNDATCIDMPSEKNIHHLLRLPSIESFRKRVKLMRPFWPALAFSTRPLNIQEMVLICPGLLEDSDFFEKSVMGLRGARILNKEKFSFPHDEGINYQIPFFRKEKVNVALTSFETTLQTYNMVVSGFPNRTLERYERTNDLINNILRARKRTDYIIFPECSVPRKWAVSIASKLGKQGVSFIAGMEYYKLNGEKDLRNDSLVSLATVWPGYPTNLIIIQPKIKPSHEEEKTLKSSGQVLYKPSLLKDVPQIYQHGNFFFGVLICSDLTDPRNRVRFQGKVDALILLEWNADINTFSYLVEGAAHDIHSFIIQVNNRMYGDSRVRTPYRKSYERDMVRLKGGIDDYFVIAEIDFLPLREYQHTGVMTDPEERFKPVPIGFDLAKERMNATIGSGDKK
ncbi:RNA-directed DNA polymerase [Enterobacter sp. CP102]|uniref:RNA-directed DNA polymerase n=1 Tax=Enterobacter sp. CP102 TaxID=2976431 RepID=UPI0021FA26A7|nr:RNA-directed DNA polymerase [Enterobacter sp. CP102]UWM64332.1 RNA-directed DNA polymerase [Enterobacter sp. CP102]